MQINPINSLYNAYNFAFKGSCSTRPLFLNGGIDTFEKRQEVIENKNNYPFCASKNLLLYKLFPKPVRDVKYNSISDDCKDAAKKSALAGRLLKKFLDNKYGEGKYVFVSVGTSPAGVAKALELMGEDVKYLPISGIRKLKTSYKDLPYYQDTDKYSDYMHSIGLSAEQVNSQDKKFLFYDFTSTGKTLDAVRYFARSYAGMSPKKTAFRSLNNDLSYVCTKCKDIATKILVEYYVFDYIQSSKIDKYAGIPHLDCNFVNGIEDVLDNVQTKDEKDFEFALMYCLDKKKKLK